MNGNAWLAGRFEQQRPRLRAVAYRMLGSVDEAEDAVQDTWLRLSRADPDSIDNLDGWLTTVLSRECLHVLRSRRRRGAPVDAHLPDLVVVADRDVGPEQEAVLADSVGIALLVVLDRLTPAERLAFVLHDLFGLPYGDIAGIVDRTPTAARKLASRARHRVRGAEVPEPDADLTRQREVVHAFYAAARSGGFAALLRVLDPEVVLVSDHGPGRTPVITRGAAAVAGQARAPRAGNLHPALVNGAIGAVTTRNGRPYSVMAFTVARERIVRIDVLADPDRVHHLAAAVLELMH